MVTQEEFGSLIAEYEGFRGTIMDAIAQLRNELEKIQEELSEIKVLLKEKSDIDHRQKRLG